MNISNNFYTVLGIEIHLVGITNHFGYIYRYGYITVREAAINGQECPQPQQNFSTDSTGFLRLLEYQTKMRIFYNCSNIPAKFKAQEIQCPQNYYKNSITRSYAFLDEEIPIGFDGYRNCEKSVLSYTRYDASSYVKLQALQLGFLLIWEPPVNCTDCELWGGRCSSNEATCDFDDAQTYQVSLKRRIVIGASAGVGSSILIIILLCIFIRRIYKLVVSYWRKKIKNLTNVEVFLENYGYLALQRYQYSDIKKLTNSFKETLGQGGYGSVFKGKLPDGRLVAVKVLNEAKGKGEDFINEVASIGRTNHVNVVSLLGFCTDKKKRALVYEYMPNGSLERFIYSDKNPSIESPLGREKLYEITLGIARGLEYLHRGCNTRILHLDIKPHNILLDQHFCPRISDFGLAKLCPTRESLVSMDGARGTPGYIAPEVYCRNFGGISHKSDVYSYGMMVLEIIGGRKNIDATVENLSEIFFPHWVYNRIKRHNIVEGTEEVNIEVPCEFVNDETVRKIITVALWCIQPHPGDRPSMSKVLEMLEGKDNDVPMPPNPFPNPSSISSATSS